MANSRIATSAFVRPLAGLALFLLFVSRLPAQPVGPQPVHFRVDGPSKRLEMIVNTSRILTMDFKVPRLLVNNTDVIRATPLSPNQIQISALKPGVTQLNLWDEDGKVRAIDVMVFGDARELYNLLKDEFPDAELRVRALPSSVLVSGYVPRADDVSQIVQMAEEYYPKVINNMTVGGVQQVLLHVKVVEVSRTKLRKLGVDWANFTSGSFVIQRAAGIIQEFSDTSGLTQVGTSGAETLSFGLLNDSNAFFGFLEALRQNNLAKLLAEPTLVTVSGRPASFNVGGELPIPLAGGLGTTSVEFKEFGTLVDFVPIVQGSGRIRLEVRPVVTEVDSSLRDEVTGTPGFRVRRVDTAVEMKAGQTLALAGLVFRRMEAENKGLPVLADLPGIGAAFRRVEELANEVELLIMVTPEFVEALDPHEAQRCGPGELTTHPSDKELYCKGYIEVPKCCGDGGCADCTTDAAGTAGGIVGTFGPSPSYEEIPVAPAQPSENTENGGAQLDSGAQYAPPAESSYPLEYPPATGYAPSSRRTIGNPYVTGASTPSNRQGRQSVDSSPGLIGPLGYDVLN